ncbi:hypothetical protein E2320_003579, partial [Naja naja]
MHKAVPLSYPASDAFPVPHEWFQPGDLVIGGMMSHLIYHFYQTLFNQHPFLNLHDSPMSFRPVSDLHFISSSQKRTINMLGLFNCFIILDGHGLGFSLWITIMENIFLQKMQPILSQNGTCSSFIQRLPQLINLEHYIEFYHIVA